MAFDPRQSLLLWRRRERYRKDKHTQYDQAGDAAGRAKWKTLLLAARDMVARRQAQLSPPAPRIVNLQLKPREGAQLSPQGSLRAVTGHYTAGPLDRDDAHAELLFRGIDQYHKAKGWTMAGYSFGIARSGTLFLLRPATAIGALAGDATSEVQPRHGVPLRCAESFGSRP